MRQWLLRLWKVYLLLLLLLLLLRRAVEREHTMESKNTRENEDAAANLRERLERRFLETSSSALTISFE